MSQGERIRAARVAAGLTQEALAKLLSTTKQTVYKYENDIITNIPVERISDISRNLGVSVSYLIFGEDETVLQKKSESSLEERLSIFSKLSTESQKVALDYIRYLAEKEGKQ